jgi:transcriptional regulator with XRE-family HTH domain
MNAMTTISRSPAIPLAARNAPEKPGRYMRECRLRAGMSIAQVAAAIAIRFEDRQQARADIAALERGRPGDYSRLVKALRDHRAFPFDFNRFVGLAAETACHSLDDC